MIFIFCQEARCISLRTGQEHVPDWSRINSIFSEYETRTVVRIRVRGIVIRIRIRHAAIRIRRVIGARQNKGIAAGLIIIVCVMRSFTPAYGGRDHIKIGAGLGRYIGYPTVSCTGIYLAGGTVRVSNGPDTVVDGNASMPRPFT